MEKAMKVDTSTITKIRISDVQGLDPVTVFIDDHGVRAGERPVQLLNLRRGAAGRRRGPHL